jgi:hypothetical protein
MHSSIFFPYRALLKRISTILTAPPKITDKQYQEMKKMCITEARGAKAQYEKKLADKKTAGFYEQLKKMKPFYNHKEWEKDYDKQVKHCFLLPSIRFSYFSVVFLFSFFFFTEIQSKVYATSQIPSSL